MSLLGNLAALVNGEFKAVLPEVNAVVADMVTNYSAWQANPVVKSTEAVTSLVNPVAALDMQAVIGAAALVQALYQVFCTAPPASIVAPVQAAIPVLTDTLQGQLAAAGTAIPAQVQASGDAIPSHM